MKSFPLVLRVYGEKRNGQWSLICLDFNLAAQAETLDGAKHSLQSQIVSYLQDALDGGVDADHADYFLHRRAPLKYWVKFYLARLCQPPKGSQPVASGRMAKTQAVPLQVAPA